jgi:glycosyltransferase involved in cell wall biosynthesis
MKIGITLYPYGEAEPAGLAETIYRLAETLSSLETENTLVFFSKGKQQREPVFIKGTKHEFRTVDTKYFWLDVAYRQNKDIDLWFYMNPMMPFFCTPKKSIVYALDFSFLHSMSDKKSYRQTFERFLHKTIQKSALRRSSRIVTMSDFTSSEIAHFFPDIDSKKVTAIYAGFKDLTTIEPEPLSLPDDYFLSIGVIKPRKNQLRVVQGFIEAKERGLKGKLVLAGKGGGKYMEEINTAIANSVFSQDITITGYISNGQVVYAYKKARALAFPSLVEGFGFPVLEAMSLSLPVITSSTNAVGEIAGDAAICVDPESIEEIAFAMLQFEDEKTREEYIKRGKDRLNNFSWEKTAKKLISVIQTI